MIEIIDRQRSHLLNRTKIKTLIKRLTARYGLGDQGIAVAFVGEKSIRRLNREFRKKDRPTDVLSFPFGKKSAEGKLYLGDIIVCVPVAKKQARQAGHSLGKELEILVLHGFLHLAGYGHGRNVSREETIVRRALIERPE